MSKKEDFFKNEIRICGRDYEPIDLRKLHEDSLDNLIDVYEYERYQHILKEKKAIQRIIESCKKEDKEVKEKYTEILLSLEAERKAYEVKCHKRNEEEKDNR